MGRAALDAQADSSLQHSVLVESIAGAETLKAARAEGQMLGRWRRYSAMSAATSERMRTPDRGRGQPRQRCRSS